MTLNILAGKLSNFTSKKYMSFQYTYDAKGKPVGVFVPINEWGKITTALKKAKGSRKDIILNNIKKGFKQVEQIEKGKLKSIPINQLLDEL
jgi:hypothetical protein